jgi:hypothetical protein
MKSRVFPYQKVARLSVFPMLPIQLHSKSRVVNKVALVDSGAGMSVLPFDVGNELNLEWDKLAIGSGLGNQIKPEDSRFVFLDLIVEPFKPFKNLFLWVNTNDIRLVLGQANFLAHFDVLLCARKQEFTLYEVGEA